MAGYDVLRSVIEDRTFWAGKVRHDFKGVDFGLVPDYLYKFKSSDNYILHFTNYRKLYQSYNRAIKNFNEMSNGNRSIDAPLAALSNFEALRLSYAIALIGYLNKIT